MVWRPWSSSNSDNDWAWKRGHRYATIICDLEKRRIIDILSDREAATVTTWLAEHPTVSIIARDRGAGYIRLPPWVARKPFTWRTDGT